MTDDDYAELIDAEDLVEERNNIRRLLTDTDDVRSEYESNLKHGTTGPQYPPTDEEWNEAMNDLFD